MSGWGFTSTRSASLQVALPISSRRWATRSVVQGVPGQAADGAEQLERPPRVVAVHRLSTTPSGGGTLNTPSASATSTPPLSSYPQSVSVLPPKKEKPSLSSSSG